MLEGYNDLINICKLSQLKCSRGYAILDRMNATLEIMKKKKKELITRFFEIWTAKEAFVKKVGSGIKDISVKTEKENTETISFDGYVLSFFY